MSSELIDNIDPDDMTKGQLLELYKGEKAQREKLEQQFDELQDEFKKMKGDMVTQSVVNQLIQALVNDIESVNVSDHPMQNREVLSDFGTRLETLELTLQQVSSKTDSIYDDSVDGKEEAWLAIVDAAKNIKGEPDHTLPNNRVKLYKENISQATGKTKKMAQNYIEDFGEEKEGADWRPYERPCASNGNECKKKALIIDLKVWGLDND